ncbi:hypothetical protein NQK81_01805 [Amycolatopsis roodepoortensis]|uniref:hypothetical protein n=1 Tax=Amycolatopsis roodepoortensis TaxID=700274 RepID=UPI00214C5F25|nr:hypothetical protein [Amycolatopsis roodepoortensis]UUV32209.1 hypothetical protein NQK81_01805 [Amycolatopsis roodepoortensis]
MKPDDFFLDRPHRDNPLWPDDLGPRRVDDDLLDRLRRGPLDDHDDVEAAIGLARLAHEELERFGTGGGVELAEQEIRIALIALNAVVRRIGITTFELPFRDFATFKGHWKRNGCDSYQSRRDLLNDLFLPLHDELIELENEALSSTLAQPISPRPVTGWAGVDAEIAELRRHFQQAKTEQDYRNVGNDCVIITEALSRQVFDPHLHLRDRETEPPVGKTKVRIERYIEDALPGPENAELRKLARSAIEFAQLIKHRSTPTRREAGIAADTVILLANILRRLQEPA